MPVRGVELLPCGRWWDAVRLPVFAGLRVVYRLRERSGPIVEDQVQDTLHWLIPPGAAATWDLPGAQILGRGQVLAVPPAHWFRSPWTGGPATRWIIPPTTTCLTRPETLRIAVRQVLSRQAHHRGGRRPPAMATAPTL